MISISFLLSILLSFHFSFAETNETVYDFYLRNIKYLINNVTINPSITAEQKKYLNKYYTNNTLDNNIDNNIHILLNYSSKNINEINFSKSCTIQRDNGNAYTYLLILTNLTNDDSNIVNHNSIFGLCVVNDNFLTNTVEVEGLIKLFNKESHNFLELNMDSIIVLDSKNPNKVNSNIGLTIVCLIPLFIMSIIALFSLFNCIPELLFRKCFKVRHELRVSELSSSTLRQNELSRKNLFNFVSSFNIVENTDEVFTYDLITRINNDNGLAYSKGLCGVGIIIAVFGISYVKLSQIPMIIYEDQKYFNSIKSLFFPFFSFGARVAPKLLFSVSGFVCVFKFLSFLDESVEKEKEKEEMKREKEQGTEFQMEGDINRNSIPEDGVGKTLEDILKKDIVIEKDEKTQSMVNCGMMLKFYLYQTHKAIILLFIVIVLKYSVPGIVELINGFYPGMTVFYTKYIQSISILDSLGHFFIFQNFNLTELNEISKENVSCALILFWPIINEIFFFIFFIPLVLYCYKTRFNLPLIILILIFLFITLRFALFVNLNQSNEYATTYYLEKSFYGLFSYNPLYNAPYYLYGLFFGLMNYVIQKGLKDSYNGYLRLVSKFVFALKYQTKFLLYFFIIVEIVTTLVILELNPLYIYFGKAANNLAYIKNRGINIFLLIDVDIIIILIHLMFISMYVKGGNFITRFFSHNAWNISRKIYFGFSMYINWVVMWVFYQSETRISLENFSFFFYGIIQGSYLFVFILINLIFFEFPFKKIILFFKEKKLHKSQSIEKIN